MVKSMSASEKEQLVHIVNFLSNLIFYKHIGKKGYFFEDVVSWILSHLKTVEPNDCTVCKVFEKLTDRDLVEQFEDRMKTKIFSLISSFLL